MMASLSKNTLDQYNVTFKLWWIFCMSNNVDPFKGNAAYILNFLTEQFTNGASYGTLNSHRSALGLLVGSDLTSNVLVKRLMKGAYKLRPAVPKYSFTWDPQVVLSYISLWVPHCKLSLEKITKKLVMLLALCTAHRAQTLSVIRLENMIFDSNGLKIGISEIIKTSAAGRDQPVLSLPYFQENKSICPVTVIEDYISMTINIRPISNQGSLILTFKAPHKPASAQTISRWIKQVLSGSGVDVAAFSAHSTRHAATSAARAAGLSLDVIRKSAGWTPSSQSFAKFYNRPILKNDIFARTILSP